MKRAISLLTLLTAITLSSAAMAEPAYPTITLNSAEYGVGTVYMAKSMITTSAVNPVTAVPFTEAEIAQLETGEAIALDDGMALAISVYGSDQVYQYNAEEAAAILSHADPLTLNVQTGELTTQSGEYVVYGGTGYAAIVLNNAEYGIGTVYFASDYFTTEHINPMTTAPYTEAEIAAVLAGESVAMPADAVVALSVYGTDTLFFYDAEAAAKILSHADPLTLNAQTGEVTTLAGAPVAAAK